MNFLLDKSDILAKATILFFIFLAVTNIHIQLDFLKPLPLETFAWIIIVLTGGIKLLQQPRNITENTNFRSSTLFGLLFISSALISSFSNNLNLLLFDNAEFTHLLKFLFFMPFIFLFYRSHKEKLVLKDYYLLFYFLLSLVFLFRYLYLNEVRSFDSRPTINIRHGDPNFLSAFFTMIIPIAIYSTKTVSSKYKKYFYLIISLILIISNILTQSRAGIISMIISLVIIAYFSNIPKKIKLIFLWGIVFFIILLLSLGTDLTKRYSNLNDKSNVDRIKTYQNGAMIVLEKPFFGAGFHQAKNFYYQNTGMFRLNSNTPPLEIHNTYLEVLAEMGLAGFSILIGFIIRTFLLMLKGFTSRLPENRDLAIHSMASLIAIILCGMIIGIAYKDLFLLHISFLILMNSNLPSKPDQEFLKTKC